jgi:hypothetical protein
MHFRDGLSANAGGRRGRTIRAQRSAPPPSRTRVGKESLAADITDAVKANAQASESFDRMKEHLALNNVDLKKTPIILGPSLTIDTKAERFTGEFADAANKLLKREYRKPYEIPEQV